MNAADPRTEPLARAMASAMGRDPDEAVTIGLDENRATVAYWQMQVEWAVRFLAGHDFMASSEARV